MAKKKKIEDDLDLGDDLDFGDFDDFDFDKPAANPPKNTREAVSRSIKDASKGFKSSMLDNKMETVGKIAKASIPKQLSSETAQISDMLSSFKDTISEGVADVKKSGKSAADAIARLTPENSKIHNLLKKISDKLDDQYSDRGPSKEQLEQQAIQTGILEALGDLKTREQTDALVKEAMEAKRHATSTQLLQNIYGEMNYQRSFQTKVTAGYYRKSLELQYRSLFIQKTQLELLVTQLGTFRNQFETIILNTSLPDFIKARSTELLKYQFMNRARDELIGSFYKKFNPLGNIKTNVNNMLKNTFSGISAGLQGVTDAADMMGMAGLGEMGISKSYLAGQLLADLTKSGIGWGIGRAIGRSKRGKEAIYNIKNTVADPTGVMREIMKNNANSKTFLGKLKYGTASAIDSLVGTPAQENARYDRYSLDETAAFDNRAHSSIVKIIPGLLTKIYGEIRTLRVGGKPEDNEIFFNNKNDTFMSKADIIKDIKSDVKTSMSSNTNYYINRLMNIYKSAGVSIPKDKYSTFANSLVKYMISHRSSINPGILGSDAFLNTIDDYKLKSSLTRASKKLIAAMKEDSSLTDDVIGILAGIRSSLPNVNSRFQDLYKSGMGDLLTTIGVAKYDPTTGTYSHSNEGNTKFILSNYSYTNPDADDNSGMRKSDYVKQKVNDIKSGMFTSINNFKTRMTDRIDKFTDDTIARAKKAYEAAKKYNYKNAPSDIKKAYKSSVDFIKSIDKETLADYFASGKLKAEDLVKSVNGKIPPSIKAKITKGIIKARNKIKKIKNSSKKAYETYTPPAVKTKIEELNKQANDAIKEYTDTIAELGPSIVADLKVNERLDDINKKIDDIIKDAKKLDTNDILSKLHITKKDIKTGFNTFTTGINNKRKEYQTKLFNFMKKHNIYDEEGIHNIKDWQKPDIHMPNKEELKAKYEDAKTRAKNTYSDTKEKTKKFYDDRLKDRVDGVKTRARKVYDERIKDHIQNAEIRDVVNSILYPKDSYTKRIFQATRRLDKKLWTSAMAKIPGTPGKLFKAATSLTKFTYKTFISPAMNTALDMMPLGLGTGFRFLGSAMMAPFELTSKVIDALKGNTDSDSKRKGSWLSRLNIFAKDKELNKDKGFKSRALNFFKENKGLTITAGILGITMLLKNMGITMSDLVSGIKKVATGVMTVAKGIGKALSYIPGVGGLFGNDVTTVDENGNKTTTKKTNMLGVAAGIGVTALAIRHPFKTVSFASKLIGGIINFFRGKWIGKVVSWFLETMRPKAEALLSKAGNLVGELGKARRIITNPKVVAKVGTTAAQKATAKVATGIAAASSGIGALLTTGMILWELGWTIYYMYSKDMTFLQALIYQLLGWNMKDDAENNLNDGNVAGSATSDSLSATSGNKPVTTNSVATLPKTTQQSSNITTSYVTPKITSRPNIDGLSPEGDPSKAKNNFPKYTDSQFIKPLRQDDGQLADVKNINPDLKVRLEGYAKDYYLRTGKKLEITSGRRDFERQKELWEKAAKTNYTGNFEADMARARANGFVPGKVAYPSSRSPHVQGRAVDLNVSAMPNQSSITADKRDPVLDPMLAKWGLVRTQTTFNNPNVKFPERWHIQAAGTPLPPSDEMSPEMKGLTPTERRYIDKAEVVKVNVPTTAKAENLPNVSTNSNVNTNMPNVASASTRTLTYNPRIGNDRAVYANNKATVDALASLNNILTKSLQVQTESTGYLKEIRDLVSNALGAKPKQEQQQPSTLPEPVIDLTRRENFSGVKI